MNAFRRPPGQRRFFHVTAFVIPFLFLLSTAASGADNTPMTVFVSIPPQKAVVEALAGPHARVEVMVPPGASPATYEPKPRQMAALAQARIYFAVGVPFERTWLPRFTGFAPAMQLIHTEEGIEKRAMAGHHHHEDEHEGGPPEPGRHEGEGHDAFRDPHIWLSPPLMMLQARRVFTALAAADPAHLSEFSYNYRHFASRIVGLDAEIQARLSPYRGKRFLVFHPSWGYFADAYGLEQEAIEIEGKEPKPAELARIIEHARKSGIKAVFVQEQFSRKSAEAVASSIGGKVVVVNPLAEDWAGALHDMADKLADALK